MLWLTVIGWQATVDVDAAMARYRAATRVTVDCRAQRADDILVCGRRAADRWRVPLTTLDLDAPKNEPVMAQRERLLARTNNCQEMSPLLVGCGKAGIGVSTNGGVALLGERPIAP